MKKKSLNRLSLFSNALTMKNRISSFIFDRYLKKGQSESKGPINFKMLTIIPAKSKIME